MEEVAYIQEELNHKIIVEKVVKSAGEEPMIAVGQMRCTGYGHFPWRATFVILANTTTTQTPPRFVRSAQQTPTKTKGALPVAPPALKGAPQRLGPPRLMHAVHQGKPAPSHLARLAT